MPQQPTLSARQQRIADLVRGGGKMRLAELAERLGVSMMTVRRDVDALGPHGQVKRIHGVVLWEGGEALAAGSAAVPAQVSPPAGALSGMGFAAGAPEGLALGLIVPSTEHYYPDVIRGARAAAESVGARLVLGLTLYEADQDAVQIRRLLEGGVDGLLIAPVWDSGTARPEELDRVRDLGVPTVLVERRTSVEVGSADLDWVGTDHGRGAVIAVQHLAGLGHERVLFAAPPSPTTAALRAGFEAACARFGVAEAEGGALELHRDPSDNAARLAAVERIEAAVAAGVRAMFVHDDTHALLLCRMLTARGLAIPGDLAVVAYDDEIAHLADIPLTAVVPPRYEVGEEAARLLLARIGALRVGAGLAARHLDLLPTLRVRASTSAPSAR